jgi:hypothetical protein
MAHDLEVVLRGGTLVSGHEVGDKLHALIHIGGDGLGRQIHETRPCRVLEDHREPVGQDALVPVGFLNSDDVELQEFDGVEGVVIACADVWPELVRLDHIVLLTVKREEPWVVYEFAWDLDVLAHLFDVVAGTVMVFSTMFERDAGIFRSTLDDVVAWLAMQR